MLYLYYLSSEKNRKSANEHKDEAVNNDIRYLKRLKLILIIINNYFQKRILTIF